MTGYPPTLICSYTVAVIVLQNLLHKRTCSTFSTTHAPHIHKLHHPSNINNQGELSVNQTGGNLSELSYE